MATAKSQARIRKSSLTSHCPSQLPLHSCTLLLHIHYAIHARVWQWTTMSQATWTTRTCHKEQHSEPDTKAHPTDTPALRKPTTDELSPHWHTTLFYAQKHNNCRPQ